MSLQLEINFQDLSEDIAVWCEARAIKYTLSFGPQQKWTITLKKKSDLSRVREAFSGRLGQKN